MKLIRKQRNVYVLFLGVNIFLIVCFGLKSMIEAAFVFGIISFVFLILLLKQIRMFYKASLICDNQIFSVESSLITRTGIKEKSDAEKTVVSTFGILVGHKVYEWGCDGLEGIRLETISGQK